MRKSASLLSFAVLATAVGCSTDENARLSDTGGADAGGPRDGGAASGGGGAAGSPGGASAGAGGLDASLGSGAAPGSGGQGSSLSDGAIPVETADAHVPDAGTPVRGVLNGKPVEVADDYSVMYTEDDLAVLRVVMANFADACTAQLGMLRGGMFHQSSAGVYLAIAVTGTEVSPGTYKVNASSITSPYLTQPEPTVYAGFASNDAQCAEQHIDALFGTVVVETVDDQHVTGAFDVTFAKGHMSGAFDAPRCDGLAHPGPPDGGSFGCFP